MKQLRIIKKYPNRRLYDTETSCYITLEKVKDLVLDHVNFQVIDTKTDEDVTNTVLFQIINEQEQHGIPIFSKELLQNLIRFYGNSLQATMSQYLEIGLNIFIEQHGRLQQPLHELLKSSPLNRMTELAKENLALWQAAITSFPATAKSTRQKKSDPKSAKDQKE
jgi:polyhydroxyalkanoate synthesis repressor PhaR